MKHALWPAALFGAALLTACGSGGSDEPPVAVALAADDALSVPWNAASSLAVTANDTAQNGSASVSIASAPAHGSATVDGTAIRYTPMAGFFGKDSLRYTLSVGGQTAQATVQITVAADLTLSGVVRDAPLPAATVIASVGGTALPAVTADAEGKYQLRFQTSDPAAFISLKATGAGAQAKVVLTSLVGDAQQAAAAASATGSVAASALPTLEVTHVSTAVAVLTQRALGRAAASAADVASVRGRLAVDEVVEMATVVKLVADAGVALPTGSADTLTLVTDASAFSAFLRAQVLQNATLFNATQQAVLDAGAPAAALTVPAPGGADVTLLAMRQSGGGSTPAWRIVLKGDKTARVESDTVQAAHWAFDGTTLTLNFDTPILTTQFSADADPVTLQQNMIETGTTALFFRPFTDSSVQLGRRTTQRYLDGSRAGPAVLTEGGWWPLARVSAPVAISAAELAPGSRWGGVLSSAVATSSLQDTLRIVDGASAVLERTQQTASYRLVDGKLELTLPDAVYTYARMFTGPLGEEHWLVEQRVGGVLQQVREAAIVKADAAASFTAASAAKRWLSFVNGASAQRPMFFIELLADGTARQGMSNLDGTLAYDALVQRWAIEADGSMLLGSYRCADGGTSCAPFLTRQWHFLHSEGGTVFVMERLRSDYRINIYRAMN